MNKIQFEELINKYKAFEENQFKSLSNRLVQIFHSNAFDKLNYSRNIGNINNIINYIDEMHEGKKEIDQYNFSDKEFELLKKILKTVENAQDNLSIEKKILPYSSLVTSLGIIRIIKKLPIDKNNIKVFEIGPGSCYTGAILLAEGYQYSCTDNTQAFYLWQSQLFSEIKDDFEENLENTNLFEKNKISHLTWWNFLKLFKKQKNQEEKVDLIICDHALGEVKKECLRYIAKLSEKILDKNENSFFLFRAPGADVYSNYWEILKVFSEYGFTYIQFSTFVLLIPKDSKLAKTLNMRNFIYNSKPYGLMHKIYLIINRLYQFYILKKKNKILYDLKNFNNKNDKNNSKTPKDLHKIIHEKNMLSDKYQFFDFINKN